ncbi:hypothetical protein [Frankia canadensis]|nr:hypothetical protein [Frankia canadensis]
MAWRVAAGGSIDAQRGAQLVEVVHSLGDGERLNASGLAYRTAGTS